MGKNSIKPAPEPEGRPTKFTPERCADIVSAISKRVPYQLAAEANGISERTLFKWLKEGSTDLDANVDSDFAKFVQSIKKVEMQKVMEHVDMIAAKPKNWQADAWILERRWPKHFGNNILLKELNERMNQMLGDKHVKNDKERNDEDD